MIWADETREARQKPPTKLPSRQHADQEGCMRARSTGQMNGLHVNSSTKPEQGPRPPGRRQRRGDQVESALQSKPISDHGSGGVLGRLARMARAGVACVS